MFSDFQFPNLFNLKLKVYFLIPNFSNSLQFLTFNTFITIINSPLIQPITISTLHLILIKFILIIITTIQT